MNIEFAFPYHQAHWWIILGGLVLGGLAYALRAFERHRDTRLARFVDPRLSQRLLLGHDEKMRKPLFWFTFLGFLFLALTFAQPHWGQSWLEVRRQSHDILICLDTSESMLAENPLPNRLERAKQKIASLLERASGDRFGLVVFSGAAQLMCPLTSDLGYFSAVLNAIDTNAISLEGTDIAAAFEVAIDTFRDQEEETGDYDRNSRAVLLISDGEQVSGDAVTLAKELSKFARVFVIGVGDPRGAEVTYFQPGTRRGTGTPHLSKLDEETLLRIALQGQGGYSRSTPGNADIDAIHGFIEELGTRQVSSDLRFTLVNRYQWPLALAIFCFLAEGVWLVLLPTLRAAPASETAPGEQGYA